LIEQEGSTKFNIRDTETGAAITFSLMGLEGVDTELDILDHSKTGPWGVFCTLD
jgi:hypothetical protein